ncbi:MAG: hypothetical protein JXJ04_10560 [Spirochaetales bacterium]|nr:hypothetical protein [Spirochaetales bacterium]
MKKKRRSISKPCFPGVWTFMLLLLFLCPVLFSAPGDITVRARGTLGGENLELRIDGNVTATWTMTTSYQDYTANGTGVIELHFTNDDELQNGMDIQVDYLIYNNTTYQAEDQEINTGVYVNNACGGSYSEMLQCNGYIRFETGSITPGNLGDTNSDGTIDIVDALLIAQFYVNLDPANFNQNNADTNCDNTIDIVDALLIAQFYVNLIDQFPCQSMTPAPTTVPTTTPTTAPTNVPSGPVKIMPLGDSITDGFNVAGGYRIKLWSLIQNMGATIDFVGSMSNGPSELGDKNHEGHSGWTISQIDTNINGWMDTYSPRIILLHIGTNDMIGGGSGAPARLSTLIDKICAKLSSGGKLYVSTIVPMSSSDSAVRTFNAQIPGIVQDKVNSGKPVYLVEMYSALTTSDLADGVHPNRTGYDKMADVWFNAIRGDL